MDAGAPTYPVGTIAKLLLLTERRVQQLTKEGVIPRSERGRYELAPSVQAYIRYLQERSHGSVASIDYHVEKARLVKLQADKAEAELKELLGEFVSAVEVSEAWTHMLVNIKTRLTGIPSKTASIVCHETDPAVVQDILDEHIRDALMELAGYDEGDGDTDSWVELAEPTSKANG